MTIHLILSSIHLHSLVVYSYVLGLVLVLVNVFSSMKSTQVY